VSAILARTQGSVLSGLTGSKKSAAKAKAAQKPAKGITQRKLSLHSLQLRPHG
jgi:hypothetical protein